MIFSGGALMLALRLHLEAVRLGQRQPQDHNYYQDQAHRDLFQHAAPLCQY